MPHAEWHKKPYLATVLADAIRRESAEEVARLNELTDEYIRKIEENEKLYNEYYMKIKDIQQALQEIKEFWEDKVKPTVDNCKKLIKTATKARKTGETADKANTLAMSLNPVAAAIQYATKLLLDLLRSEINALFDVVSVVTPARDEFINFSGGTNSSGVSIKGSFNTKLNKWKLE